MIEMRVRVVNLNADEQMWWRCSIPAGSVVEEIREFVLSRGIGVEDEGAVGVEGEFRCLRRRWRIPLIERLVASLGITSNCVVPCEAVLKPCVCSALPSLPS